MSKTIIAVRHFGLGGRESLETAVMQAVFSISQLQYFHLSTIVELYKKNQETQKFCPLALIFHLAPYLIFIAVLKSTYPERMVLVTQYKQYFHVSATLLHKAVF